MAGFASVLVIDTLISSWDTSGLFNQQSPASGTMVFVVTYLGLFLTLCGFHKQGTCRVAFEMRSLVFPTLRSNCRVDSGKAIRFEADF